MSTIIRVIKSCGNGRLFLQTALDVALEPFSAGSEMKNGLMKRSINFGSFDGRCDLFLT